MKRKQGLRWKKFKEMHWRQENRMEMLWTLVFTACFDALCGGLFLLSAAKMVEMFYGPVEYRNGYFAMAFGIIFLLRVLLEIVNNGPPWLKTATWLGCLPLGAFVVCRLFFKEETIAQLSAGFRFVASVYLEQWNLYFGSNLMCPGGKEAYGVFFLETGLLSVVLFFFLVAKLAERNGVMAFLPIIIFIGGLIEGASPEKAGVLYLFFGILLCCNQKFATPDFIPSEEKRGKQKSIWPKLGLFCSAACVVLLCLVVLATGKTAAEHVVTEYTGPVEDIILDRANRVANWEIWRMVDDPGGIEKKIESILGTTGYNYEQLSNRSPLFEDVPYLKVTTEEKPAKYIYLKGFYGDIYENGIWERNQATFVQKTEDAGYTPEFVTEELAVLGVEKLKRRYNIKRLSEHSSGIELSVHYLDPATAKAYVPYFSEKTCDGISLEAEGNLKKRLSEEQLSFTMWKYAGSFDTRLRNFEQGIPKNWEEWYEDYVLEQYLAVPENMTNVKKIAANLAETDLSRTKLGSISSENEERLAKAYVVADWMGRNTVYSQVLPKLPFREDPIEYFLGSSRTGYCMHYASASVMILREMGVPARYASGYVVSADTFEPSGNEYAAEVLDNQAHAWAEVYLNGIGWVPVEVTAGYSTLIPTPTPTPTPTHTPTPTPTPTNTPTPTHTPTPVLTVIPTISSGTPIPVPTGGGEHPEHSVTPGIVAPTATNTPTPTPTPTPVSGSSELGNEITDSGITGVVGEKPSITPTPALPEDMKNEEWDELITRSILVLAAVLVFALILLSPATVVDRFFRLEKISHRRIKREMGRKGNTRAIKMLNHAIYRKLCFNDMIKKGCTDAEYEAALKKNFSVLWPQEWDRYMDIVKAAEFSLREFTEEEVEFCYKVYRDIIY